MRIAARTIAAWPKLAWVAQVVPDAQEVQVLHGPMVETGNDWIVEAVWAGEFASGDFDRTDLVFGTGIRVRGERVVFVSAGTTFDRLWYCRSGQGLVVANTLPGLLSVSGWSLRTDYPHYARDIKSITQGLDGRVRSLSTDAGEVTSVYFNNLVLADGRLCEVTKPDTAPEFTRYSDYRRFLSDVAAALGANMNSCARRHPVTPLASISSGYDSCAASVVARDAGCRRTVTITQSTSLWRGSDSGAAVAKALGMDCSEYARSAPRYTFEEAVWAACAWPGILNWTLFDYPEPLCLFFTGCHGEKMWDRVDHDHSDPFVRRDVSSLGFCEFRLIRGVFQSPVPYWGVRHSQQLKRITLSEEMQPWWTGKDYDKPIPRRIVEEANVPRAAFGTRKKNSVIGASFLFPLSPQCQSRFREYLRSHNESAPSARLLWLTDRLAQLDNLVYRNTLKRLNIARKPRPWSHWAAQRMLFPWANHELTARYMRGLCEAEISRDACEPATR